MSWSKDATLRRLLVPAVGTAVGAGVLLYLALTHLPVFCTGVWWFIRANIYWMVPLAVLGDIAWKIRRFGMRSAGWGLLALVFLAWTVVGHGRLMPETAPAQAMPAVPGVTQGAPFFKVPYDTHAFTGQTGYLPHTGEFSSLVRPAGLLGLDGYDAVMEQSTPVADQGVQHICYFSDAAQKRLGGWFGHDLEASIVKERRQVKIVAAGTYAFCGGPGKTTPFVVVPLIKQSGWLAVTDHKAGVAIYNGVTGQLMFSDGTGLPGPAMTNVDGLLKGLVKR